MKYNLKNRLAIAIVGTAMLFVQTMTYSTDEPAEDIEKRSTVRHKLKDQFYTKDEFDNAIADMKDSVNTIWIITASVNIISMQLGFSFLEVGSINAKNKANILIKNLLDTYIGALAFYVMGYAFANEAGGGLIGTGNFFCRGLDRHELLKWLF